MAVGRDQRPTPKQFADVTDQFDEFLVHEKFDNQRVFGLMGRSGPTNQLIAEAYSKAVDRGLKDHFGDTTLSDKMAQSQRLELERRAVAYFDAIDAELAASKPAARQPSVPGSAPPPPPSTGPAKSPTK
jgi:hypothetical protein